MTLAYDSVGAMLADLEALEALWYDETADYETQKDMWGFRAEYRSEYGEASEFWVGIACMEITDAVIEQARFKYAQARQRGMTWIKPEPCLIVPVGVELPKCPVTVILVQPVDSLFPEVEAALKPAAELFDMTTKELAALLPDDCEPYQGPFLIQYANSNELLRLVNS